MKNSLLLFSFLLIFLFGCTHKLNYFSKVDPSSFVLKYSVEVISSDHGMKDTGSGTSIYNANGYSYILTCYHVVSSGGSLSINYGGKKYKAYIVRSVPHEDLAILSTKENIPVAPLSRDKTIKPGNKEIIAGYPLDEGLLLTQGFFGAEQPFKGYHTLDADNGVGDPPLMGFGSASAWPGNSGGGVFALANGHWVLAGVTSDISVFPIQPIFGNGVPYAQLVPTLSHYIPVRYALPILASIEKSLNKEF